MSSNRGVVVLIQRQLCPASLAANPADGDFGIGVDGGADAALLEQGQGMDDGQEFADVVGSVRERTLPEDFAAGADVDATVFEGTRIAAARSIDRIAVQDGFAGDRKPRLSWSRVLLGAAGRLSVARDEFAARALEGFFGQFQGIERFVTGA